MWILDRINFMEQMINDVRKQEEKNVETAVLLANKLAEQFAARADEADIAGVLPAEDVAALKESGYLGISVPREFGGYGLSLRDCVAAQLALALGSTSSAIVAGMQVHIFGHQREVRSWDANWYEKFCRLAANGALFNSIASEPALGSPSRGGLPATTAVPPEDGEGWRVNGRKTWSTGGRHLTHMLVRAAVGEENGVILIKQGQPGVSWVETWSDSLSLRASDSHDVIFEDVLVSHDCLIEQGDAKEVPNIWFPMVMSAVYLGTAVAARNAVIKFALERVPTALGKPIATLPKIQRQIGEIDLVLQAARSLLFEVAGEWCGDEADRRAILPRIAAAKTMVTNAANEATEKALRVAGGTSITKALPLERYFRDVRAGSMQPPSGDTALEIIGRAAINEQDD